MSYYRHRAWVPRSPRPKTAPKAEAVRPTKAPDWGDSMALWDGVWLLRSWTVDVLERGPTPISKGWKESL